MAIARETWSKELYLADSGYRGEFLPTLNKHNPEMGKNKSFHITVIPAQSAVYQAYGAGSAAVTYTLGAPTDKEVIVKDTARTGFKLNDEQINTTETAIISGFATEANESNMNAIEAKVALDMAINCLSTNKIEMADGNQLTFANISTARKNMIENGSKMKDAYMLVNADFEYNIRNITDNSNRIFIDQSKYPEGTLKSGVIGTALGFKIILCTNLPTLNDAGTAYDAAGETAMIYYDADCYSYGADPNPEVEVERDIDVFPIMNKVLIWKYTGHEMINANKCGHIREYSAG